MSMSDRSEGEMTALVERVAEQISGEDVWAEMLPFSKFKFKEWLLPILTKCVEAVDAEPHKAKRGDEVEAWIKRTRDDWATDGSCERERSALDDLLDDYRLHADTATPLSSDVDEMGG